MTPVPGKQRLAWSLATIALAGITAWLVTLAVPRQAAHSHAHTHAHGEGHAAHDAAADFHQWMHDNLGLTDEQHATLEPIEHAYEVEKQRLEEEIAAAGRDLATAVRTGKSAAPEIDAALHRLNDAQARLQRATLDHFFAMKEHLDPEQSGKLLQWTHDSILAK
ncbi:periplasmic heavy metal sensor [Luteolibacter flavescens]|uniref:Periplasmic heavy metal sensor n=1 Tax=Luteolibacter flavescens TaxID=1859460 RepID=A0ABT3FMS0_9BACT|nr:periplasmic heavy metal sensor [Luteolibacter flavescens]MCW1884866.1 periplasmic heavy metal sensor [Luteolibacter flavescens]